MHLSPIFLARTASDQLIERARLVRVPVARWRTLTYTKHHPRTWFPLPSKLCERAVGLANLKDDASTLTRFRTFRGCKRQNSESARNQTSFHECSSCLLRALKLQPKRKLNLSII